MTVLAEVGRPPLKWEAPVPVLGSWAGWTGDEQEDSWFLFLDCGLSVAGSFPLLQPQLPCHDGLT